MESDPTVKGKIKMNRIIRTEYLLNNVIDEDFQAMLLPLRIFQSFFFMFKFRIINNFITPEMNTSFYIKSVLGSAIVLLINYVRFVIYDRYVKDFGNSIVTSLLHFNLFYFSLLSVMIYIDNALKRINAVELVIKLQNVLNSMKDEKAAFYLKHKIQNWLSIISLVSVYIVDWWISTQELGFLGRLVNFLLTAAMIIFDMNIVNVTRTVAMIKNMLVAWTHTMQECKKKDMKSNEMSEKVMFDAYSDIIKSFRLCNKIYEFTVTYFAFQTFMTILITLESVIELGKSSPDESFVESLFIRIVTALWNIKNLVLLATLSIACENFYTTVKLAERTCAEILNVDAAAGMRKTCKNVFRLNGVATHKLTAYDLFELDAAFPLRLLAGLVSYTVVLLQVALRQFDTPSNEH